MAALGVANPGPSAKLDTTVEDRLAKEKKEAEEKAQAAEREAEERERIRRERLESEKALKDPSAPTTPASWDPTPVASARLSNRTKQHRPTSPSPTPPPRSPSPGPSSSPPPVQESAQRPSSKGYHTNFFRLMWLNSHSA